MFRCNDCTSQFEEPNEVKEEHGEVFPYCPDCGSDDFEEMKNCEICGEPTTNIEFCRICHSVISNELEAIVKMFEVHGKGDKVVDLIENWVEEQ